MAFVKKAFLAKLEFALDPYPDNLLLKRLLFRAKQLLLLAAHEISSPTWLKIMDVVFRVTKARMDWISQQGWTPDHISFNHKYQKFHATNYMILKNVDKFLEFAFQCSLTQTSIGMRERLLLLAMSK